MKLFARAAFLLFTGVSTMYLTDAHGARERSPKLAPGSECRPMRTLGSHAVDGTLYDCAGWAGPGSAPYYLHVPPGNTEGAPVIVVVHGISRNAREHVLAFGSQAARQGFVTIAPRFSRQAFPGYQRLGRCGTGRTSIPQAALEEVLDEAHAATGADTSKVFMFGFSGGAQFAHRFALCTPGIVRGLVLASAGWYTFPDTTQSFPRGVGTAPLAHGLDVPRLLQVPTLVVVGDQDTRRDGAFNASRALDRQQGRTRIERGRNWVGAMQQAADRDGLGPRFTFGTMPGCGHHFGQCATQGGLVQRVLEFFQGNVRRALPVDGNGRLPPSHLVFSAGTGD
jgi:dienelactone hydrolase